MRVDPRFRAGGRLARRRRARRAGLRATLFGLLPLLAAAGAAWTLTDWPGRAADALRLRLDGGERLVQVDDGIEVAPVVAGDVFLDIPGDPTILALPAEAETGRVRRVPGPGVLDVARVGLPAPDRIGVLRDDLVVAASRLATVLPSGREEFAFLQAQRDAAAADVLALTTDPAALLELAGLSDDAAAVEGEDSYGTAIAGIDAGTVPAAASEPVERTGLRFLRDEAARAPLYEDVLIRAERPRPLAAVLAETPLGDRAEAVAAGAAAILGTDAVEPGALVAVRLRAGGGLAQMSLYAPDGYRGTVAEAGGTLRAAADPWLGQGLDARAGADAPPAERFRLLDAIYSAGLRGGLPPDLAGTFTALLARHFDLERPAAESDRITLAFAGAHGPGGTPEGQLLYAALEGAGGGWRCYVVPDRAAGGFRCHVPGRARRPDAAIVTPVEGVLTSKFGPRRHPILETVRLHAGIDWAAPVGTPVRAAAAGKIVRRGGAGGYGNLVAIAHAGGLETRYAHLDAFAEGQEVGTLVRAGEVIGTVGTTGRSTGPHLHFEMRLAGTPVDPLPIVTGATRLAPDLPDAGSAAVEALVAQIIRVESAGDARAKNPRSTATGLGQFIESTWLRMMRTYRPDLVATLSRDELLRLRLDPTLSREMVTRLAQENEAFLRARGHAITPGRLYLAHFLGPGGAHRVLSAPAERTILDLMGAGVVRANPFLRRYDVSDLRAWAERKMGRMRAAAAAPPPPPEPVDPEVEVFVELIDAMVARTG